MYFNYAFSHMFEINKEMKIKCNEKEIKLSVTDEIVLY